MDFRTRLPSELKLGAVLSRQCVWAFVLQQLDEEYEAPVYKLCRKLDEYLARQHVSELGHLISDVLYQTGYLRPRAIWIYRHNPFEEAAVVDHDYDAVYHLHDGATPLSNHVKIQSADRGYPRPFDVLVSKLSRAAAPAQVSLPVAAVTAFKVQYCKQPCTVRRVRW